MLKDKVFKPAMVLVNQKPGKPPEKKIKADKISYDNYIKHVGFFGEMYGVRNGAKMYGDYMKIAEYYKKKVESKYGLDKFMPSS